MFNQKSIKGTLLVTFLLILAACGEVGPSPSFSSVANSSATTSNSATTTSLSESSSLSEESSSSSSSTPSSSEVPSEEQYQIYLLALQSGYEGTYEEWLDSIKGADGSSLLNGETDPEPSIGNNGDTYINTTTWDVFIKVGGNWTKVGNVMGPKGDTGEQGPPGQDGQDGADGLSAYEIYKKYYPGYPGTEQDWINDFVTNQLVKTVTLNFDGGATSTYKTTYFKGEQLETLPTTTKQYYTFDNWQINNEPIGENYYVVDNVTITAKFTILEGGIVTAQDLINIKDKLSGSYFLVNDIDLGGVEWTPIGTDTAPFTGTFDGQGFTISNLKITTSQVYVGLFGYNEGTIKNLKLDNVYINVTGGISSNIYGGAFIGYNNSNRDLENLQTLNGGINIKKRINSEGYVGGLVGYQFVNLTIANSSNNLNITGDLLDSTGGIVGLSANYLTIINTKNSGSISGVNNVGGFLGNGTGTETSISESINTGLINGNNSVGGFLGKGGDVYLNKLINKSPITGTTDVGGLVGSYLQTIINHSFNFGSISGQNYVGGLTARGHRTNILNSFNSGSISGQNYVGGLIGVDFVTNILNSYNSGKIYGLPDNSIKGGLIGQSGESLFVGFSVNFGDIYSTNQNLIGNIVGYLPIYNDSEQTYYSGTITANGVVVDGVTFGTKVTDLSTFNLEFFTTTLGWDTEIWDFTGVDIANGVYPTLKNMPEIPVEE